MIFKTYADYYNIIYQNKPYKKEAKMVYDWAGRPKEILELGCGIGKHAEYWASQGATITAIDNSIDMLKHRIIHPKIWYLILDINNFQLKLLEPIECAIAMFNVMGYIQLEECLKNLPLKENGYFIFDVWDIKNIKKDPPEIRYKQFDGFYRVAVPKRTQTAPDLLRIDYFIIDNKKDIPVFERHYVKAYSLAEIKRLCDYYNYKIIDTKNTKTWVRWYKLKKE